MSELKDFEEKYISGKLVFDGRILHVYDEEVLLPNHEKAKRELIKHIGAVCIIPITDMNEVIMEHQYRYPIHTLVTEIPAGKLDSPDEDRLEAAKRELREETGYTADNWTDLGLYYPAPAYSDEKITMYMATGLHEGNTNLDEDEFLEVVKIPLEDLKEMVLRGEITDGKTQIAILKAAAILLL